MRRFVSIGIAAAVAASIAVVFISHGGAPATPTFTALRAAREDCSTRSEANFAGAFTSRRNLVVGPLVLVGGAYTDAATVRKFGGNKFPLLVRAGHVVTLQLASSARR